MFHKQRRFDHFSKKLLFRSKIPYGTYIKSNKTEQKNQYEAAQNENACPKFCQLEKQLEQKVASQFPLLPSSRAVDF